MDRFLLSALMLLLLRSAARAQLGVPAGLTNIGVAAAVLGPVSAAAPSQVGRELKSGRPVYLNDHVTTGPGGRLQILLLDETTFTLGPGSDMVLDEFVYDPRSSAGKVSARIAKGAFRFITGKIARKDPANMKVTLPVGTIGIRGTMVAGRVEGRDADVVLVGPGPENNAQERRGGITVFNGFGRSDVNASGYGVSIRDGGRPSRGFRFSPGRLSEILDQLEPRHAAGKGGPADAERNSGDILARGGLNYRDYHDFAEVNSSLGQTTSFASQLGSSPVDNWSDLLAIQSGVAGYQGSGSFTCSGSGCSGISLGNSGTFSYGFNVDFANRSIASVSPLRITGSSAFDSVTPSNIGYSNLIGKASYSLTSADNVQGTYGTFAGTTLTFLKTNGQPAGAMQINLNYSINYQGNVGTASGTSTVLRGAAIPAG